MEDAEEEINVGRKLEEIRSIIPSDANEVLSRAALEVNQQLAEFSVDEEEKVVNEVDELLEELTNKPDLSSTLKSEFHNKMQEALRKCMNVMMKQRMALLGDDDEDDMKTTMTNSGGSTGASSSSPPKQPLPGTKRAKEQSNADALMIQMLQKKTMNLKKNLDLSEQKARAVTTQW
jgi:ribosomal protein S13